jgi:hypothetical protein
MFESIVEFLLGLVLEIFKTVWAIFFDENYGLVWWLVELFLSFGEWFLLQLIETLGMRNLLSRYSNEITETMELCSKIDAFVPLYESVELLGIFLVFLMFFLFVKMILKLIPCIG